MFGPKFLILQYLPKNWQEDIHSPIVHCTYIFMYFTYHWQIFILQKQYIVFFSNLPEVQNMLCPGAKWNWQIETHMHDNSINLLHAYECFTLCLNIGFSISTTLKIMNCSLNLTQVCSKSLQICFLRAWCITIEYKNWVIQIYLHL